MGILGLKELSDKKFYRDVVIEFIATAVLLFVISIQMTGMHEYSLMHSSLCTGFAVTTIIWTVGSTSGGLIDPAITLSAFSLGRIPLVRCIVYIFAQCGGAYCGTYVARSMGPLMVPADTFAMTLIHPEVSELQAIILEFIATGLKSVAVFATMDKNRPDLNGSGPLAIGLSCIVPLMTIIPYTGCSINPARSFGPALLAWNWTHQWVFWVGPISGAVAGAWGYVYFCSEENTADAALQNETFSTDERAACHLEALDNIRATDNLSNYSRNVRSASIPDLKDHSKDSKDTSESSSKVTELGDNAAS